jgi:hypothetical protein
MNNDNSEPSEQIISLKDNNPNKLCLDNNNSFKFDDINEKNFYKSQYFIYRKNISSDNKNKCNSYNNSNINSRKNSRTQSVKKIYNNNVKFENLKKNFLFLGKKKKYMTSEQIELENIKIEREKIKNQIKKNQEMYNRTKNLSQFFKLKNNNNSIDFNYKINLKLNEKNNISLKDKKKLNISSNKENIDKNKNFENKNELLDKKINENIDEKQNKNLIEISKKNDLTITARIKKFSKIMEEDLKTQIKKKMKKILLKK